MMLRAAVSGLLTAVVLISLSIWIGSVTTRHLDEIFEARTHSVVQMGTALVRHHATVVERSVARLAARSDATSSEEAWRADARRYIADTQGLTRVAWVRRDGPSIIEGSEDDSLPLWIPRSGSEPRWRFGEVRIDVAILAADGGWVIASLATTEAFESLLDEPGSFAGHDFALLAESESEGSNSSWAHSELLTDPFPCRIEVQPTEADQSRLRAAAPVVVYASLIGLSLAAALGVALCTALRMQALSLKRANLQLTEFNDQLDELVSLRTLEVDRARVAALNIAKDTEARASALGKSEAKLRSVLESATDGILMVDDSYVVRTANPAALGLFRRAEDEVIGHKLSELITGLPAPAALRPFSGSDILFDGRLSAIRPDGSEIALSVSIAQTPAGPRTVVLGDLSRWLAAEARFQEVVESSPSALVMIRPDGTISMVNSATEEMFGYEPGELADQEVECLLPYRFREAHPRLRGQFFEEPSSRPMGGHQDLYALRRDGTEFPVEIGLSLIDTEEGPMALGAVVDISERVRSELALKRYATELESKNRDLDSFAHAVSHDLKAPLRGITSIAQWTIEDYSDSLDQEGKDNLILMHQRCLRLSRLIDGILEYLRVGRENRSSVLLDSQKLFDEVVGMLDIPEGIEVNIARNLPSVRFDPVQLQQVIQNLLSNAVKYMGSDTGRIDIGVAEEEHRWIFRVSDTGEGIDPRHFDRIFAVFQTLRPRDEVDSTGVGLSLVQRIIEIGGGKVWVESEPGQGSDFFFSIPKTPPERLHYAATNPEDRAVEAKP